MRQITYTIISVIGLLGFLRPSFADSEYSLNMLSVVNQKRASHLFLKPYKPDPELQVRAELISMERASISQGGHLTKRQRGDQYTFYPLAKGEGVGYSGGIDMDGSEFITCFLYSRQYEYAGAGMAISRDGITYYTLLVR